MIRRIVLQLADDTDDVRCGKWCPLMDDRDFGLCVAGFRPTLPNGDHNARRSHLREEWLRDPACRSAELRPETVDVIRAELGYIVRNFREDDPNRVAWADALADFERLFGGER